MSESSLSLKLGRVVMTPGVEAEVSRPQILNALRRHAIGDWGLVTAHDHEVNEEALKNGDEILSIYYIDPDNPKKGRFYVKTEHDRSVTTALLPDEY